MLLYKLFLCLPAQLSCVWAFQIFRSKGAHHFEYILQSKETKPGLNTMHRLLISQSALLASHVKKIVIITFCFSSVLEALIVQENSQFNRDGVT